MGDLCVKCTMCCNGTLYPKMPIKPSEREALGPAAEIHVNSQGGLELALGCRCLSDAGACQIYERPPSVCRSYSCSLLESVKKGEFTAEEALAIVDELHGMFDKLQKFCQSVMPEVEWPYLLVGRGVLMELLAKAEAGGAVLSRYDLATINTQQRFIVQYIRQHLDVKFMQPFVEHDAMLGERAVKAMNEAAEQFAKA
ncbi:YkgJ family cysteine cluster protein [Halocynthiibacter styelae]|uniref:YkgJ family cysteine cluster protein n=1 Tax=Halocynthiibacter styelae TaxID=2761955 RepID=A0A8J7IDU7_9RHOB|nr:YkgJ family cysteine cluster protein [Paenihalocynthiibacter styelae]MBI1492972.1 YkgJ family cysteine cluster protein [Paenihalocynthiibacter styelae]